VDYSIRHKAHGSELLNEGICSFMDMNFLTIFCLHVLTFSSLLLLLTFEWFILLYLLVSIWL
jgi:hypothetical protein